MYIVVNIDVGNNNVNSNVCYFHRIHWLPIRSILCVTPKNLGGWIKRSGDEADEEGEEEVGVGGGRMRRRKEEGGG